MLCELDETWSRPPGFTVQYMTLQRTSLMPGLSLTHARPTSVTHCQLAAHQCHSELTRGSFFIRVWASKKCKPFCFTRFKGARPSATRRYCFHRPHLSRAQHLIKRPGRYYGVTLPQKPNGGMSSLEAQGLALSRIALIWSLVMCLNMSKNKHT